jgi:hypothetical protein
VEAKEGTSCGPGDNKFTTNTVSVENDERTLKVSSAPKHDKAVQLTLKRVFIVRSVSLSLPLPLALLLLFFLRLQRYKEEIFQ